MKYLSTYNESVRDMMTPKSEEDIENSMKGISLYRAGKLYSSMVVRMTGKVSDNVLKHLPLIIKCHQEVFFNPKVEVDKYLKEGWKYIDYRKQTDPEDMLKLSFEVTVKKNNKKILVSQHKNNNYLHCSFINPATDKLDITTLRSVKDFNKILNDVCSLNESIRDKMTSTSIDDIKDRISQMKNNELYGLLWNAALEEDVDTLNFYLDLGLDINIKNNRSETLLMDFVRSHDYHVVKILLELGADLNIGNDNGYTALVIATFNDSGSLVKLLLSNDRFNPKKHDQLNRALRISKDKFLYVEKELVAYKNRLINESVRDKMTPKSAEDIRQHLKGLSRYKKIQQMYEYIRMGNVEMMLVLLNDGLYVTDHLIDYSIMFNDSAVTSLLRHVKEKQVKKKLNESLQDGLTMKPIEHITSVGTFYRYNFIEDGKEVGYIVIDNECDLFLSSFTIWDPYKGKGLGRKYLNIILDELKKFTDYPWVGLSVDKDNEIAINLYQSVGFRNVNDVAEYEGPGKNYKRAKYYYMIKENK